jgi:hypothetical protein
VEVRPVGILPFHSLREVGIQNVGELVVPRALGQLSWKLEVGRACLDTNHSMTLKISGICVVCIPKYCEIEHIDFLNWGD